MATGYWHDLLNNTGWNSSVNKWYTTESGTTAVDTAPGTAAGGASTDDAYFTASTGTYGPNVYLVASTALRQLRFNGNSATIKLYGGSAGASEDQTITLSNASSAVIASGSGTFEIGAASSPGLIGLNLTQQSTSIQTSGPTMTLYGDITAQAAGVTSQVNFYSATNPLNFRGVANQVSTTFPLILNIDGLSTSSPVNLHGANLHTGGTTLSTGTLGLGNVFAIGSSGTTFSTLTIQTTSGNRIDNVSGLANLSLANNPLTINVPAFTFVGTNSLQFNAAVTLQQASTVTTAASTLTFFGNVSGAFRLTKAGSGGSLALWGTNSHSGTTLTAGTLLFNSTTAVGAGASAFIINGGTLDNTSGGAVTNANNNPITVGGDFTFTGSQALNLGTGAVTLAAVRTVSGPGTATNALTFGGVVAAGVGGWNVRGAYISLTGTNLNTGKSVVGDGANASRINIGNANGLGATPGAAVADQVTINAFGTLSASATLSLPTNFGITLAGGASLAAASGTSFTINGIIAESGGARSLSVASGVNAGTVALTNANTFSGNVSVLGGVLYAQNATALGGNTAGRALTVADGAAFATNTSHAYSNFATSIAGAGTTSFPGALNILNPTAVDLGAVTLSAAATIRSTSNGAALSSSITNAGNLLTVLMPTAASTFTMSGLISGAGGLTTSASSNDRTLFLSNTANTFTGQVSIAGGRINANFFANAGVSSSIGAATGTTSDILLGSGSATSEIALASTATVLTQFTDRVIDLTGTTGTAVIYNGNSNSSRLVFTAPAFKASGAGPKPLLLSATGGSTIEIRSVIVDNSAVNVTRLTTGAGLNGTYVLTGLSTYTGATTIGGSGTVEFDTIKNVGGGASSFGAPTTVANGTISVGSTSNTGTLRYVGSGSTTDRVINLAAPSGSAVIDNRGTGPLVFTSAITATGVGAKAFTLSGSNYDSNDFQGAITNAGGNVISLVKTGVGYWKATGANSYTGNVTVSGGQLDITALTTLGSLAAAKGITVNTTGFRNSSVLLNVASATYPSTLSWFLAGSGPNQANEPMGAIRALAASTISGTVTMTGNSAVYADTGNLTLNGLVSGNYTLLARSATGRTVTISGGITAGSALQTQGPGTTVWNGSASNLATIVPVVNGGTLRMVMTAATGQFAHPQISFGSGATQTGIITSRYQYTGGTLELSNSGATGSINYAGLTNTTAINIARGSGKVRLSRDAAFPFTVTLGNTNASSNGATIVEYGGSAGTGTIGTDSSIVFNGLAANNVYSRMYISDGTALVPVYINASKVAVPTVYGSAQTNVKPSQNGGTTLDSPASNTSHNVTGDITAQVSASVNTLRLDTGTITLAAGAVFQAGGILDAVTTAARTIIAAPSGGVVTRTLSGGTLFHIHSDNSVGTGATITATLGGRYNAVPVKTGSGLLTLTGVVDNLSGFLLADGSVSFTSTSSFNNPFATLTIANDFTNATNATFAQASDVVVSGLSGGGANTALTLNGGDLVLRNGGSNATFGGDIALGGSQKLKVQSLAATSEGNPQAFQGAFPFTAIEMSRGYISLDPQYGMTFTGASAPTVTTTGGSFIAIQAQNGLSADYTVALGAVSVGAGNLRLSLANSTTSGNPYNTRVTVSSLALTGDATANLLAQTANPQQAMTVTGATTGQPMGNGLNVWNGGNIAFYRAAGSTLAGSSLNFGGGIALFDTVDFAVYGTGAAGDANFPASKGASTNFTSASTDNINVTGAQSAQTTQQMKSLRVSSVTIAMQDATQQIKTDLLISAGSATIGAAIVGGVSTGKLSTQTGPLYINTAAALLTINSDIVDNGGIATKLIFYGTQGLTLSGNNTYTGGTVLNGGVAQVYLNNASALGTGPVIANGSQGFVVGSAITTFTFGASNAITLNDGGLSLVATAGKDFVVNAPINGGSAGMGDLYLTGAGNHTLAGAFNSGTDTTAGTLRMSSTGTVTLNAVQGFTEYDFGTGGMTFKYGTGVTDDISGKLTLRPNNTYRIDTNGNNVTWASSFGNGSTYVKVGDGTHRLEAENFLATITIGNMNGFAACGTVVAAATNALGYGTVTLQSGNPASTGTGAAVHLTGDITLPNAFTVSGNGIVGAGLIRSIGGSNTVTGAITITVGAGGGRFGADAGTTLTLSGGITTNATLRFAEFCGVGVTVVTGVIADGSVTNTLAVQRIATTGVGVTRFTAANTYSRGTIIDAGTIQAGNVSALGTGAVTISSPTATLQTLTTGGQRGKLTVKSLDNTAGGIIRIGG